VAVSFIGGESQEKTTTKTKQKNTRENFQNPIEKGQIDTHITQIHDTLLHTFLAWYN